MLYDGAGSDVIDSAMYEENGRYYLFVKSDHNPSRVILLTAPPAATILAIDSVTAYTAP